MSAKKKGLLMLTVLGLVALTAMAAAPGGPEGRPGDQAGRRQPPPMLQMTANQQSLFILAGNKLRRYDAATLELKAETELPDLLPQRGAEGQPGGREGRPQGGQHGARPAPPADQQ